MPRGIPKNKARPGDLMVTGKRNRLDRAKDGFFAINEFSKGKTYAEITRELNEKNDKYALSESRVREDIQELLVEWKRENMATIDAYIAKEVLYLDNLAKVAMENFETSKTPRPQEYASLIKVGYTREDIDEIYKDKPLSGNPAFLATMLDIQKQRLKLMGIDKGNDVAQTTITNYNFGDIREEELAALADTLQDRKAREIISEKAVDEQ